MNSDPFPCTEANFVKLSETLSGSELWNHRVSLFSHLADALYAPKNKKFKFGFLSYFVWLVKQTLTVKAVHHVAKPPGAEFLVHIVGNVSKEVDTLAPVVSALQTSGHSVLVLWGGDEVVSREIVEKFGGAAVWRIRDLANDVDYRPFRLQEIFSTLLQLCRAFWILRPLADAERALWKCRVWWFNDFLHYKSCKRMLGSAFATHDFKGVAVASETAASAEALCRIAIEHGWPVHHFLHGLPDFNHTHAIASDVHCFSQADRDYFISRGHSPQHTHATGHPRQSGLADEIGALRTISPKDGGLRILFASQPPCSGFNEAEYYKNVEMVLQAATSLNLGTEELRIRLHPVEDRQTFLQLANRYAPDLGQVFLSSSPVAEDLAWANVLLTSFSTMSMEAAYAGSLLAWLSGGEFQYEIREKLAAQGYGQMVESAEQLAKFLALCRDQSARCQLLDAMTKKAGELRILNPSAGFSAAECMVNVSCL